MDRNEIDRQGIPGKRAVVPLALLLLTTILAFPADADEDLPAPLSVSIEGAVSRLGLSRIQALILKEDTAAALRGGADPVLFATLIDRLAASGSSPDDLAEIARRARRLSEGELPPGPVLDRYLQGLSKGVPLDRIRSVADGIEERLRLFASLVAERVPGFRMRGTRKERLELISEGAYALDAGAPAKHLGKAISLDAAPDRPFADMEAPVLALGCLVAGGITPDRSLEVIETAHAHGMRGPDLERIGRDLALAATRNNGVPTDPMVDEVLLMLRGGERIDHIAGYLETMCEEERGRAPGTSPMDDPSMMHGPGGSPEDPGHQGTHGHGGHGEGMGGGHSGGQNEGGHHGM